MVEGVVTLALLNCIPYASSTDTVFLKINLNVFFPFPGNIRRVTPGLAVNNLHSDGLRNPSGVGDV